MKKMKINRYALRANNLFIMAVITMWFCSLSAYAAGYPDLPDFLEPTTGYLSFTPFNPPIDHTLNVSENAPQVSEWTRCNKPGDTMAMTGENLSAFTGNAEGSDTRFVIYGEGAEVDGLIQRLDGQQCALTLPYSLPPDDMYLMWSRNDHGFGAPVAINQTEAWWVGFDEIERGDEFFVYGRNLKMGNGECHLFYTNSTSGVGGWLTSLNANPYKAPFVMPKSVPADTYTIWAHNGKGRKYGWSDSLTLTVKEPQIWSGGIKDMVADFGADGNDENDDQAAFDSCTAYVNSHPYTTITIPAGTYYLSNYFKLMSKTRYIGAGIGQTIIKATPSGRVGGANGSLVAGLHSYECKNMSFMLTESIEADFAISLIADHDALLENVEISQTNIIETSGMAGMLTTHLSKRMHIRKCKFVIGRGIYLGNAEGIRVEETEFIGIMDNNQMVTLRGVEGADISNCDAEPLDQRDPSDGYGWCKGRWFVDLGSKNLYFADNESHDMRPRIPTIFESDIIVLSVESSANNMQAIKCVNIPDKYHGFGNNSISWAGGRAIITMVDDDGVKNESSALIQETDALNDILTIQTSSRHQLPTDGSVKVIALKDIVDQNAGEQYLLEGPLTYFVAKPSEVESSEMVFDPGDLLLTSSKMQVANIVKGRGMGQTRGISSITASNSTLAIVTLSKPWNVLPDKNSVINFGTYPEQYVFYGNTFDGRPEESYTASAGIALWGTSGKMEIENNTFHELRSGIPHAAYGSAYGESGVSTMNQHMFNRVVGNRFVSCRTDLSFSNGSTHGPATETDVSFIGNVYRNNYSTNASHAFTAFGLLADLDAPGKIAVWQDNTVVDAASIVLDSPGRVNQVWIGNTLHSPNGIGWDIASDNTVVLQNNNWSGVSSSYAGSQPGAVLELPNRVAYFDENNLSGNIPVYNSGTDPMDWSASETSSWLKLKVSSGTVMDEAGDGMLSFELVEPAPSKGSKATITVSAGGKAVPVTVIYESISMVKAGGGTVVISLEEYNGETLRAQVLDLITKSTYTFYGEEHKNEVLVEDLDGRSWTEISIQKKVGSNWVEVGKTSRGTK